MKSKTENHFFNGTSLANWLDAPNKIKYLYYDEHCKCVCVTHSINVLFSSFASIIVSYNACSPHDRNFRQWIFIKCTSYSTAKSTTQIDHRYDIENWCIKNASYKPVCLFVMTYTSCTKRLGQTSLNMRTWWRCQG